MAALKQLVRSKVTRLIQAVLTLLVVTLAVAELRAHWGAFRAQQIAWRVEPGWLCLSVLTVFGSYAVLVWAWRHVVVSQRQRLPFSVAVRIWALASLGKYVPGKIWAVAAAGVLAQRAGVDASVAVVSAVVLQALAVASGVVLAAAPIASLFSTDGQWLAGAVLGIGAAGAGGLWALSSERIVAALRLLAPARLAGLRPLSLSTLAAAFAANLIAWLGYGLALVLLARGVLPEVSFSFSHAVGIFAAAYTAGFVVLIAPGGIGPRESVFVLLSLPMLGPKAAVALAVASRLHLTFTELVFALPFLFTKAARWDLSRDRRGRSSFTESDSKS